MSGFALALGCGPALEAEPLGDDEHAADSGDTGGQSELPGSTTEPVAEATSEGSTEASSSDGSTDWGDESDEGGESDGAQDDYGCGCDADLAVGADEAVDGYSAMSVLASLQTPPIAWEWVGFADSPTETTMALSVQWSGGQVMQGPGGDNGCGFLSAPCPNALRIPVTLTLSTADGLVAATVPGTVDVDLDRYALSVSALASMQPEDLGGTFADESIPSVEDAPTELNLEVTWGLDGSWVDAHLAGNTADGYGFVGRAL